MSMLFMTKDERKILYEVLDKNKFWLYGEQEACFEDDVKAMILQAIRKTKGEKMDKIDGKIYNEICSFLEGKGLESVSQKDSKIQVFTSKGLSVKIEHD